MSTTFCFKLGKTPQKNMKYCKLFMVMKPKVVTVYLSRLNDLEKDIRIFCMIRKRESFDLSKLDIIVNVREIVTRDRRWPLNDGG
jgi:hypothetical protein